MPSLQKPEPRTRVKRRKQRHAAKVIKSVRQQCVERDGDCRIGDWEQHPHDWHGYGLQGTCDWFSEWAHLGEMKRSKTRGRPPELRHTTAGSLMLCRRHHQEYDQGWLGIVGDDANRALRFDVVRNT